MRVEEFSPEADAIIAMLERAFGAIQRGSMTLHEAKVIAYYGSAKEQSRARKRDPERDWRDVPDASIVRCRDALPFLDNDSWRFYLPAFMRHALRHLGRSRKAVIDETIYSLLPAGDKADDSRKRFWLLDSTQVEAVRLFLEFAAHNQEYGSRAHAAQALERYWRNASGA